MFSKTSTHFSFADLNWKVHLELSFLIFASNIVHLIVKVKSLTLQLIPDSFFNYHTNSNKTINHSSFESPKKGFTSKNVKKLIFGDNHRWCWRTDESSKSPTRRSRWTRWRTPSLTMRTATRTDDFTTTTGRRRLVTTGPATF